MVRYFYDDRYAAAFMAKNYGMQIADYCRDDEDEALKNDADYPFYKIYLDETEYTRSLFISDSASPKKPERYYIHPDSLHLLEPMVGDLVMAAIKPFAFIANDEDIDLMLGKERIVIQRDGISFHWPKSES